MWSAILIVFVRSRNCFIEKIYLLRVVHDKCTALFVMYQYCDVLMRILYESLWNLIKIKEMIIIFSYILLNGLEFLGIHCIGWYNSTNNCEQSISNWKVLWAWYIIKIVGSRTTT